MRTLFYALLILIFTSCIVSVERNQRVDVEAKSTRNI